MIISGHKTGAVFDRYNIMSQDYLKKAASKRHAFNEKMAERRLQFGYSLNLNEVTLSKNWQAMKSVVVVDVRAIVVHVWMSNQWDETEGKKVSWYAQHKGQDSEDGYYKTIKT